MPIPKPTMLRYPAFRTDLLNKPIIKNKAIGYIRYR